MNKTANIQTDNSITPPKALAQLQVVFGGYSDKGIKNENQDAFAALIPNTNEIAAKGVIATIADGVSSASHAAQASQLAVTQFITEYIATPDTWSTNKSAAKVLTSLNQWLFSQGALAQQQQQHEQWLTTFSALILKSNTGYIFHVGDSRITKYRDHQLEAITRDHNRKNGSKSAILTRALGADNRLEVDCRKIDLKTGDIFLLTCDGVHDFVSTAALKNLLNALPAQPSSKVLQSCSQQIVAQALKEGSDDNVSCLLAFVEDMPQRKLEEIERDLMSKSIPPALKVGMKIDNYIVRKVIYASIRSHLYLVEQQGSNKKWVLKAPSANFTEDAIYLQGFQREAWVGERIKHPNVMSVKTTNHQSRFLYNICDYIEGQTLTEWMHDNPLPSIAKVRDIISQIISALRAFQRLELVHRDLKPDNIMIDTFGQIKLIDYGTVFVASLDENQDSLKEEVPQGSLNYIAPETLLKMHADYRSDLFSLAVICYEMLSGELPYKPMTRAEVTFDKYSQWQYRSIKLKHPEFPLWLDLTLERATAADPQARFQAFSEFQAELNKPNNSAIETYKKQPLLQRNPVKFWQLMSALLTLLLLISIYN